MQGPFLAIFAMELGEHNAKNKTKKKLKKNSLCQCVVPFSSPYLKYLKTG